MIHLELYNQNYDSKINEFPTRNAILRIYYLIKDNIEQETFAPMLVYLNKTPILGQTFLCCSSASTRKSWLRRRPCVCGCPDEMKCQTTRALEKQ